MFEQSMVVTSPETRRRKRVAALLSVAVETGAVAAALCLPLFTGQALPPVDPPAGPVVYHRRPPSMEVFRPHPGGNQAQGDGVYHPFVQPLVIPVGVSPTRPKDPIYSGPSEPPLEGVIYDENAANNPLIADVIRPIPVVPVSRPPVVARPSEAQESLLIGRVNPTYPSIARSIGLQGTVVLQAMISRTGTIEGLEILRGHPVLARAAVDAVLQWRYRPYLLNGQPVDVRTEITVNFVLTR